MLYDIFYDIRCRVIRLGQNRTFDDSGKLIALLVVNKLHIAIFFQYARNAGTKSAIRHRLGTEISHQRIAREGIAMHHFFHRVSSNNATRIDNLNPIIKYQ